jgi:hypothetical protein
MSQYFNHGLNIFYAQQVGLEVTLEIGASSLDWALLSSFYILGQRQFSLQNIILIRKQGSGLFNDTARAQNV